MTAEGDLPQLLSFQNWKLNNILDYRILLIAYMLDFCCTRSESLKSLVFFLNIFSKPDIAKPGNFQHMRIVYIFKILRTIIFISVYVIIRQKKNEIKYYVQIKAK